MDRRYFLKQGGIGLASFGLMAAAPNFLHQYANAAIRRDGYGKKKVLVTIFQRGAVDGLNMVVPHGDSEYYNLRRTIAINKPGAADGAVDLDGFFGLHPSLKPLEKFWQSKQLAVVHSAGSPNNTRSHFDAQDYMESATPGVKATRDGWLNRVLQGKAGKDESPFRAVSMSGQLPRSLYGRAPSIAMTNLADFAIKAGVYTKSVQGGFEGIWQESVKDSLSETGAETFQAVNFLKEANPAQYKPENGAVYPNSPLGRSLMQIAQLIKAGVGLEVAFAEANGWDTHNNQGGVRGQMQIFCAISETQSPLLPRIWAKKWMMLSCSQCRNSAEPPAKTAHAEPITDTATRCSFSEIRSKAERFTAIGRDSKTISSMKDAI